MRDLTFLIKGLLWLMGIAAAFLSYTVILTYIVI